jgi:insulin receptor
LKIIFHNFLNLIKQDNLEAETTKKKDQDNTESRRDNITSDFVYFYKVITDPAQTSFELHNLTHYTNYQIFLRACREKLDDSTTDVIENNKLTDEIARQKSIDDECGPETQITQITLKKPENDLIPEFEAQAIPSNNSLGSIKIRWSPPPRPNGMILSYTIQYKKNDIDHTKYEPVCVTQKRYANQSYYILNKLTNGNYSISVAALSMAGMGNYTIAKNVVISLNETSNMWYIVLGLTAVFSLLILAVAVFFKRYYSASMSASMKLIASVNPDYAGVHYKQDSWEVPRDKVIQLHELGQGSFGMVYEGIIKDLNIEGGEMRCAIKTVNENATDKERISFLNEASVMKQFDTAFVVRLLGVVSQSQPTFVVMELMANGDLKGYLRSHRPEYDNGTEPSPQPPTLKQLFQMSAEIADGMSYLSAKKFVHRDLAARNCMVAEDLTVKIGDFGMTRDIYETDYYRKGTKGLLPGQFLKTFWFVTDFD